MPQEKIGRYIIKGTLGRGAMGMVYLALDPVLDRQSAIKVMNTGGEVDEGLRTRFFREARSVARLRHPNIIAIYELGEDGKRPFIAMEYVEGEDLKALVQRRAFLPFDLKIRIIMQVCHALHYAHQQGVLHRDIKPANVRITRDHDVRILDFGLARLGSSDITRTGMLMGTPYYMSPEQVRGSRSLDGRSDLFSVGVLLYELVSLSRPFEAESSTEVCLKIVSEAHLPLSHFLPAVDKELEQIIDRSLSKDREARYADCEELAGALKKYLSQVAARQEALAREVKKLEADLEKCREDAASLATLGILDLSRFNREDQEEDSDEATVYAWNQSPSDDYGGLLLKHAQLHQQLTEIQSKMKAAVPIKALFERSSQEFDRGDLESCLGTLGEVLELHPQNARALEMQRQCHQLLEERRLEAERRARLQAALSLARESLQQGSLAQCIQAASRALQLDPGNAQAQELKQAASDALVRRRKVTELQAAARGYSKAQNHQACLQAAAEALTLEPANSELRMLHEQSLQILARQQRVHGLIEEARNRLQSKEYHLALEATAELLALEPDLPRALDLQRKAAEALEHRLKIDELLAAARGYQMGGDFEACWQAAEQGLALEPDNDELLALHFDAQQSVQKQRKLAELLDEGREQVRNQNFDSALETLREALTLDPEHRLALELYKVASEGRERKEKVGQLLSTALGDRDRADYTACLRVTAEALALEPGHAEHLALQRWAQDTQRRIQQLNELMEQARQYVKQEEDSKALEVLDRALKLEPKHPETLELRSQAAERLARRRRFQELLAAARAHVRDKRYSDALFAALEGLDIEAEHSELKQIHQQASVAVERAHKVKDLLERAGHHHQQRQHEAALEIVEEALKLDPGSEEALALQRAALEGRERRQRFEALLVAARGHSKARNFAACVQATSEALELEPDHGEIRKLHDRASQELARLRTINDLLGICEGLLNGEDFSGAMETADEILKLEPGHTRAHELQRRAAEQQELQQKFEELLVAARESVKTQDYEACYRSATQGLKIKPEHTELRKLHERAFQALERQRGIQSALERARRTLAAEKYEESLAAAQEALALDGEQQEARDLRRRASAGQERQNKIAELLGTARELESQQKYQASREAITQALALKANHPAGLELLRRVEQAWQRQQRLADLLERAQNHLQAGDPGAALALVEQALEIAPAHTEAGNLNRVATEALMRRQKVDELLAAALGYCKAQDYESCLQVSQEGLELDADNTELNRLKHDALQALDRKRQIDHLLAEGRQHFQKEEFEKAMSQLSELLALEPQHAGALELRRAAAEAEDRRRKIEQLLAAAQRFDGVRDYEACQREASQGLKLAPDHAEFRELLERSQQGLQRLRKVSELLESARRAEKKQRLDQAVKACNDLLVIEPGHAEAREILARASGELERQKRVGELLAAAQASNSSEDYEGCLQAAREGLKLQPDHAELRRLQDHSIQVLEQQRSVKELLAWARRQVRDHDYAKALQTLEGLFQLAPGHAEGIELKRSATEALERRRQLEGLLAAARAQHQAQDFEACIQSAKHGLEVDPGQAELRQLLEASSRILELRRQAEALLEEARRHVKGEDYAAALNRLDALLKFDPGQAEGIKLRQTASEGLERVKRKRKVEELLAAARMREQEASYEACYRAASEGLQLDPGHVELGQIQQRAGQILEKQRQVNIQLDRARRLKEAGDWPGVLAAAEKLLTLDPDHSQGTELKRQAALEIERQEKLAQCLNLAQESDRKGDVESCLQAAEAGLGVDPKHAELEKLRVRAAQVLEARHKVAALLQSARQLASQNNHEGALREVDALLRLEPSHAEALKVKQSASEALQRQRKIQELLNSAKAHAKSGDLSACVKAAEAALVIDPAHAELKELHRRAVAEMERRRKIAESVDLARRQWGQGDCSGALEATQVVLNLDPKNAEATQLQQQASQELERRRRVEELLAAAMQAKKAEDHEACYKAASEGLRLAPDYGPLKSLAQEAAAILEKRRTIKALWDEVRRLRKADGKLEASLKALEQLLSLAPDDDEAQQLYSVVRETVERRRKVSALLAEAAAREQSQDFAACIPLAVQALELDPGNVVAQGLRERAEATLKRQQRINELTEKSAAHLQRQEYRAAVDATELLLQLDPRHARALEIRHLASEALARQQRLEQLLAAARRHDRGRDFDACLQAVREALELEPEQPELIELKQRAQRGLEIRRQVALLLEDSRRRLQAGDLEGAAGCLKAVAQLDPENSQAQQLRSQIAAAAERRQKIVSLLEKAKNRDAAEDFAACYQLTREALELDPQNPELRRLHEKSSQILEVKRREQERRSRIQHLLTSARVHVLKSSFGKALKDLSELLELDPGNAEALTLQEASEEGRAAQRRKLVRAGGLAAAVLVSASLLATGVWFVQELRTARELPSKPSESEPVVQGPPKPVRTEPPSPPTLSPAELELRRLLETARDHAQKKQHEAALRSATEILRKSPGNEEAQAIQAEAKKNLDLIAQGLRQAQAFSARRQYPQAVAALSNLLRISPSHAEANAMLAELAQYARSDADTAQTQMRQAKSAAEQARANLMVRDLYDIAGGLETEGRDLYQAKEYGKAMAKWQQASDTYRRAETKAAALEKERQQASVQKPPPVEPPRHSPPAEPSPTEQQRQLALQQDLALRAQRGYEQARTRAVEAGADKTSTEQMQQARTLASHGQEKLAQRNFSAAQQDFEEAARRAERAAAVAEESVRQAQAEASRRSREATQQHTDRQAVDTALRLYREALENKDIDALKKVWPGIGRNVEDTFRNSFKISKSLRVDLEILGEVRISESLAVVNCRKIQRLTTVGDGRRLEAVSNATFRLRKNGDRWVIDVIDEVRSR